MSETAQTAPEASDIQAQVIIHNFSVTPGKDVNGEKTQRVTFGTRAVEFRKLDITDSWDMLELAGENANQSWLNIAMIALSVTEVDNIPLPPNRDGITKQDIRRRLKQIGSDGLQAVARAMEETQPTATASADDTVATAKN